MRSTKLLYFFRPLASTPLKWAEFRKFLLCDFFGKKEPLVSHLDNLEKAIELGYSGEECERFLFQRRYPHLNYSDLKHRKRLRTKLSLLLGAYFEFRQFIAFKANSNSHFHTYARTFNAKGEDKYFDWFYNKAMTQLEKNDIQEEMYLNRMILNQVKSSYLARQERDHAILMDRYSDEDATRFYVLRLLKKTCSSFNHNLLVEGRIQENKPPLLESSLEYCATNDIDPITGVYYRLVLCFLNPDDLDTYKECKDLLFHSVRKTIEYRDAFRHLSNFIARGYAKAATQANLKLETFFLEERKELYRFGLSAEVFFSNEGEALNHIEFTNVIAFFAKEGELEEALRLIDQFGDYTAKDISLQIKKVSMAIVHYYGWSINEQFSLEEAYKNIFRAKNVHSMRVDLQLYLRINDFFLRILFELGFKELEKSEICLHECEKLIRTYKSGAIQSFISKIKLRDQVNLCKNIKYLSILRGKIGYEIKPT